MARLSNFWVSCIQCPQYWSVSSWNEMRFLRNKSIINHKNWSIIIRNLSKLHGSVKAGTLFTRERVIREVTSQGLLIKHGPISAEEAPLGCLNHRTLIVLNWETDVKNLTSTLDISIVSISLALAREGVRVGTVQDILATCREAATVLLGQHEAEEDAEEAEDREDTLGIHPDTGSL